MEVFRGVRTTVTVIIDFLSLEIHIRAIEFHGTIQDPSLNILGSLLTCHYEECYYRRQETYSHNLVLLHISQPIVLHSNRAYPATAAAILLIPPPRGLTA